MREKQCQFQVDPRTHPLEAANVVRQHADRASPFEPTVPLFDDAAPAHDLLACRGGEITLRRGPAWLGLPPRAALGSSIIDRRQQLRLQAATRQLMQGFAVVAAVADN